MNSKSLLKQAEQNAVNNAKFWLEFLDFVDAIRWKVDSITEHAYQTPGKVLMLEGFAKLREGAYCEMQYSLSRCFAFVGVGGEEAAAFSRERAKKVFEDVSPEFLDANFRVPRQWMTSDMDQLQAECDKELKK